jgi:hypothetical protein
MLVAGQIHRKIPGNEKADALVKTGTKKEPPPSSGVPYAIPRGQSMDKEAEENFWGAPRDHGEMR